LVVDVAEFKEAQKTLWSLGDFADIAHFIRPASETVLEAANVVAGDKLLDVACGTGNLALPAAAAGAEVTGIDITPGLLEVARAYAEVEGLQIDFQEGDAEALQFADSSFDKVISVFGMIFAPQHDLAAAEMVRTCRPGGTVAIAAWTPTGMNGEMFTVVGTHMPPPEDVKSPIEWGTERHVREEFGKAPNGDGIQWTFLRENAVFSAESVDAWVDYNTEKLGPLVLAKAALEPQGKWEALKADLHDHYSSFNSSSGSNDEGFIGEAEYLLAVGKLAD
jgi:ubiquinone/menaquinone biosynthesis C-methylase UbiE